ncbi:MAG: hypothetical protein R3B99_13520 [Polyangiales bacterium]
MLGTHAAILARPAAPTDAGHFEVLFMRYGDELRPVASHEARWQVDVAEGEVVIRAFGENASRVRLKPNGDVIIEASGQILGGSAAAAKPPAMAEETHHEFDVIRNALTGATPGVMDGGAALLASIIAALTASPRGDVGSTKMKLES